MQHTGNDTTSIPRELKDPENTKGLLQQVQVIIFAFLSNELCSTCTRNKRRQLLVMPAGYELF